MTDIKELGKWLAFSDKECSLLATYFPDFARYNKETLTKEDFYILGVLSCELQYNMRLVKSRIIKEDKPGDKELSDKYLNSLLRFDGLIDFCRNSLISDFEKQDINKQYEYLKGCSYSFFSASKDTKKKIETEIGLLDYNPPLGSRNQDKDAQT